MARVLIGWELGAGSGHSVRLTDTAAELRRRGHEPILAVQQTSRMPGGYELWQAPLWPALLTSRGRARAVKPSSFGDILVALGMGEAGVVSGLLRAWDAILAATRPDVVAAEFAPALLMAAHGRMPTLLFGSGFGTPPPTLPAFPSLTGGRPAHDEAALLQVVNRERVAAGRKALPALPAMFAADRTLAETFRELDPYRRWRSDGAYSAPHISNLAPVVDGRGEEVFVYTNGVQTSLDAFVGGLVDSGLKVRLYDPRFGDREIAMLERAGITCERRALPFARIAERSRLVVSHGGLGLACAALCAGLPQVAMPFDLEKRLTGDALEEAGLGRSIAFRGIDRGALAALLQESFADDALAGRALAAAPDFRARAAPPSVETVACAVEALARA